VAVACAKGPSCAEEKEDSENSAKKKFLLSDPEPPNLSGRAGFVSFSGWPEEG
jgi:hypothetical protein